MSIPASEIVSVNPNVLAAGGNALDLNGLMLTDSLRIPIGSVAQFADADAVESYFGASSREAAWANIYFAGFENSNAKPGRMLAAQYPLSAVAAFLRGASLAAMSLAELQAINGTLALTIDGSLVTQTVNLGAATSFSSAAEIIAETLAIDGPTVASVTGSISGTTLTVSAVASGALSVGDEVSGTGVTTNTRITAFVSGTGGVGTYTVDTSQTALSQAITAKSPGAYYDSVSEAFVIQSGTTGAASTITFGSGAMATSLNLTSVTGAVISQGDTAAAPVAFMDDLVLVTQNWATFFLSFDPDEGDGNDEKLAFAEWTSAQDDRYAFACWDTDASPTTTVPATSSLGYLIGQNEYAGVCLLYDPDEVGLAAFVAGYGASLDFTQLNGRFTLAFRRQDGLAASVEDATAAQNLMDNGYNFYGSYATADDEFIWLYPGKVSGDFLWMDSFLNQIWMNNGFQLSLMTLLQQVGSIPYNAVGRATIEAGCADIVTAALNFGAIRSGVTLSSTQIAAVNAAAGVRISNTLTQRGWYLQVKDATPEVRAARQSPPCTFWYMDGQSVQQINLTSVELQ